MKSSSFLLLWIYLFLLPNKCVSQLISNLPIVKINTNGKTIVDEPKINATIKVIYNENGGLNNSTSTLFHFNGFCGVEYKGSLSLNWPKKNLSIELRSDTLTGNSLNFPLVGLPTESDWVLVANYYDSTYIKNELIYNLSRKSGIWAPRTKHCEVYINDVYQGLYVLTEKIKRNAQRVNIKKLESSDISLSKITGGYIVENNDIDSVDVGWTSYKGPDPKTFEITSPSAPVTSQINYIKNYFDSFENSLLSPNFSDSLIGFRNYIDVNSFIKNIIFQEFSKNSDAYHRSQYFYKDRGGKLFAGPIWDFDYAFGLKFFGYDTSNGWRISQQSNTKLFWFPKFITDCDFLNKLIVQYKTDRNNYLDLAYINNNIDSVRVVIQQAAARDRAQWFPNASVSESFDKKVDNLKIWVKSRLQWMDENFYNINLAAPTLIADTNKVNKNTNVTFTLNGCSNNNITWKLKNANKDSLLITTVNQLIIPITINSTVVGKCMTSSGCVLTSNELTISIIDRCMPTALANPSTICSGATSNLSATCVTGTPTWYTNSALTIILDSTKVSPIITTTYYLACLGDSCNSAATNVIITVYPTPTTPNNLVASNDTICLGSTSILSANCTVGILTWYTDKELYHVLASSIVKPMVTTTYYAACLTTTCKSTAKNITIIVNSPPTAPTLSRNPSNAVAPNTNVTITSHGCYAPNILKWENNTSDTLRMVMPLITTTYTATCSNKYCSASTAIVVCLVSLNLASLNTPTDDIAGGTVLKEVSRTDGIIKASNKITGAGTIVTYKAGSNLNLIPGFKAERGTVFTALIGGCQ